MNLEQFVQIAKSFGPEGIVVALVVLLAIYVAKFSGLVKSGSVARIVNIVLAVVFSGYTFGDDASAFVATIGSLGSALLYTLIEWALAKATKKVS